MMREFNSREKQMKLVQDVSDCQICRRFLTGPS